MNKFFSCLSALLGALLFLSTPVLAQEVTLNSIDGSITMSGILKSFDGETYIVSTAIGEITILASQVDCEGEACPVPLADLKEFTIAGSSAIGDTLLPTLIEAYALERGGDMQVELGGNSSSRFNILDPDGSIYTSITVVSGTSEDAFSALLDGSATTGMSSRAATATDISGFAEANQGDLISAEQERIIALDGIIAVVHRDNPIAALTLSEIAQIFAGEVSNWAQFGGLDAPITLYRRDENSGTTAVFQEIAMARNNLNFSDSANILQTNSAVSDAVGRDLNGIGITSIADERNARSLSFNSTCGQVLAPSDFTIKTEEYPLARRMYLYSTSGPRPDRLNELFDFISSNLAQEIAENAGFIGQNVARISLDEQGRRIANAIVAESGAGSLESLQSLLTTVLEAERLSLTFRFISGTSQLDNRALGDIERLAAMIRTGDFANREILALGFTDNIGAANENTRLSQERAEQVQAAIMAAAGAESLNGITITPMGYGNVSPLACNDSAAGRQTNRRVELWIR